MPLNSATYCCIQMRAAITCSPPVSARGQDVEKGLQDGTLLRGKLRINARRRSTAFVTADGGVLPSDIFLENEKSRNRAQDGDVVRTKSLSGSNLQDRGIVKSTANNNCRRVLCPECYCAFFVSL